MLESSHSLCDRKDESQRLKDFGPVRCRRIADFLQEFSNYTTSIYTVLAAIKIWYVFLLSVIELSLIEIGGVPQFTNLSSPELETILTTLREKIIMPQHLTSEQRDLIYKAKNHKALVTDPVTATLDGEEFVLKPINRRKDLPRSRQSLYAAVDLMKTKGDWDNFPRLLEGLRHGGLQTSPDLLVRLTRKAGQAGRQDVVLECARQAEATGYYLNNVKVVRQILWWFQAMAVDSGFSAETTKKALSWSEQIFDLMELPEHGGKTPTSVELDPRVQSQTIGILLELAAVRASKHLDGKDTDGKVAKYAEKLAGTSLNFGAPEEPSNTSLWVSENLPLLYGMKVALKVLDPTSEVAKNLQAASDSLQKDIDGYRKQLPKIPNKSGKPSQALELYKTFFEGSL